MAATANLHLPEETLDDICALSERATLFNLCLTSKSLNRIATARLYSSISMGHLGYPQEDDTSDTHITQLTYLFLTSPTHAALVNSVEVLEHWGRMDETWDWCDKLSWPGSGTSETETLLKHTCAKYASTAEETEEMYSMIKSGTQEDATLALLIASLPNLCRLDISFGCGVEHSEFVWLFEKIYSCRAMIDRLNPVPIAVMVKGEDDKYPNNPTHLAIFFRLPNLRAIYGYKLGNDETIAESEESFARLRPRACPVETIELRSSKLRSDNFRHLINATIPGKLKTLIYEIGGVWAWCQVEHTAIMDTLAEHHDTLENLCLSHEDYYPYQNENSADETSPCNFTCFTGLKRLKVAPAYIWGHDGFTSNAALSLPITKGVLRQILPENLEQLWITKAQQQMPPEEPAAVFERDCLLPALDLVIQHKTQSHPKLSHLCIEFSIKKWELEWLNTLATVCERAQVKGIDCTIIVTDVGYRTEVVEKNWGWNEDVVWIDADRDHEARKYWIIAADEPDLAQKLRDLKMKHEAEKL